MPTPNFGLPLYGDGDTSALDTLLNGQATALDTNLKAIIDAIGHQMGTDDERKALAGADLFRGLTWYSTDTDTLWRYTTSWVIELQTLRDFTPVISGLTVGNGTLTAKFSRVGKLVTVTYGLTAGSSTDATGIVALGLPTPSETSLPFKHFGTGAFRLGTANVYPLMARWFSATPGEIVLNTMAPGGSTVSSGANISASHPTSGAWTTGTTFYLECSYEASN